MAWERRKLNGKMAPQCEIGEEEDEDASVELDLCYTVSRLSKNSMDIFLWTRNHINDPALIVSLCDLTVHFLLNFNIGLYSKAQRSSSGSSSLSEF